MQTKIPIWVCEGSLNRGGEPVGITLRHHLLDLPVEATGITYTQAELVQTLKLLKQQ
jgi:hypothetical protein